MTDILQAPEAIHIGIDDLPFVDIGGGNMLKVIHVDERQGLWIIENIFQNGFEVQTHKHTGPVFAVTLAGSWKYIEYPEVNTPGSYLFEPAGSVHTLTVPTEQKGITDVWFAIYGANLNLDSAGNVEAVIDAELVYQTYLMLCRDKGVASPAVIVGAH